MMRRLATWMAVLSWSAMLGPLYGGIEIAVEFEHSTVLQFEPVIARAQVVNDSEYAFVSDSRQTNRVNDIWLEVESEHGGEKTLLRPDSLSYIYLLPDEGSEFRFDLSEAADLTRLGTYFVRLAVQTAGGVSLSEMRRLEVVRGFALAKTSRAVPHYADMTRSYSLLYWAREGHESLFLSIEDPDGHANLGVFDLGPLVRVTPPKLEVKRDGSVIVVHQSGYRRFTRTTLKSTRDIIEMRDQTYHLPDGRPYPKPSERKPLKLKKPKKRWWEFWK